MSDDRKKAFWFIALLSMLVILPFLGETIFYSKGEPREAIVAFSMLESGNWILPVNYGTDRQKISEIFGLTDNQALHTVIAFGYPSHTNRIEDMKDGDVKYYLDDNRDYVVPKRRVCDVVKEI